MPQGGELRQRIHPIVSAQTSESPYSQILMSEPDYTRVSHSDVADVEAADDFPSSFHNTTSKKETGLLAPLDRLKRSYNARRRMTQAGITALFVAVMVLIFVELQGGAGSFLGASPDPALAATAKNGMMAMKAAGRRLNIATWNIAAINNNPFEYWITMKDNPKYEQLMVDVEHFLDNPGDKDLRVDEVFTPKMYQDLDHRMNKAGWPSIQPYWDDDFSKRKIISEFMKDDLLGSKRLISMLDRITNTINVDGKPEPVCRPTVINMYEGDLSSMDQWWSEWTKFIFDVPLNIKTKEGVQQILPQDMIGPIKKSKYPDITEEEEKVSLPLQTLCGAIFDAILVHMMNTVSTPEEWQPLKRTIVEQLNRMKVPHTMQILESTYIAMDIITLQEVSSAFIDQAKGGAFGQKFHVIAPADMDATRDQNSVVCLNKETFPGGATSEITSLVKEAFPEGASVPVANGDILAITTSNTEGVPFVVASFHGDTNGLATKPVTDAIAKAMATDSHLVSHRLIFGLDANTYEHFKPGKQQDVMDYGKNYVSHGLTSCWGDVPQKGNYTTYNARTYLQPQLNKACKSDQKRVKGDVNPKDFILFNKKDFEVVTTWKDNTGQKTYIEDMAFPTLEFPSDHGILATTIQPKN